VASDAQSVRQQADGEPVEKMSRLDSPQMEFHVWSVLLCEWSLVFQAMLRSTMREANGPIRIEDFSEAVVEACLRFIHSGVLKLQAALLVEVAAFADKYEIGELKQLVKKALCRDGKHFGVRDLQLANFSVRELKEFGKTPAELKDAGVSAVALKDAGVSARFLRNAGFAVEELRSAGFSAFQMRVAGASWGDLLMGGYTIKELKYGGCTVSMLQQAGCSVEALKAAGFSVKELRVLGGISVAALAHAGFDLPATMVAEMHHIEEEEDEELEDVPLEEKIFDPFYHVRLKRNVRGVHFDAKVEDIERGVVTKKRLYRIIYADGDLEHLSADEVWQCLLSGDDSARVRAHRDGSPR